jgi:hypothetical protein
VAAESQRARIAWGLASLAPALLLLGVTAGLWVDAPLPDDVDAILDVANRSAAAGGLWERAQLLLEPHVDHRIVATRAAAALQLALCGSLDLRALAALGAAALLSLGWLLPRLRADPSAGALAAAAPVCWLLFQPQAFDALISPTMGANLLVLPVAAGVLLALRGGSAGGFALAAGLSLLAQFSQGNGVLVLPAALLALWLADRRRAALAWLGVSAVCALLYVAGTTTSRAAPLPLALSHPLDGVAYALAFLGSALGLGSVPASVAAGASVLVFVGLRIACGDPRRSPWLWGALAFALLSVAANALGRAELGVDYAVSQPRYRLYSALVLALCHLVAFERWGARPARVYAAPALLASIGFCALSYAHAMPEARALSTSAARGLARFAVTGAWVAHPRPAHARDVLAKSRALGIFAPDPEALAPRLDREVRRALPRPSGGVSALLTRSESGGGFRLLEGRVEAPGLDPARLRAFLVFGGGERIVSARLRRDARGAAAAGMPLRFRSIAPAALVPEALLRGPVGLLVSDGTREAYAASIAGSPGNGGGAGRPHGVM